MSKHSRSWGLAGAILLGAATGVAKAEVAVDLVPDSPGPYVARKTLTVDVWLHSEVAFDVSLFGVQLDFSNSDPALTDSRSERNSFSFSQLFIMNFLSTMPFCHK